MLKKELKKRIKINFTLLSGRHIVTEELIHYLKQALASYLSHSLHSTLLSLQAFRIEPMSTTLQTSDFYFYFYKFSQVAGFFHDTLGILG